MAGKAKAKAKAKPNKAEAKTSSALLVLATLDENDIEHPLAIFTDEEGGEHITNAVFDEHASPFGGSKIVGKGTPVEVDIDQASMVGLKCSHCKGINGMLKAQAKLLEKINCVVCATELKFDPADFDDAEEADAEGADNQEQPSNNDAGDADNGADTDSGDSDNQPPKAADAPEGDGKQPAATETPKEAPAENNADNDGGSEPEKVAAQAEDGPNDDEDDDTGEENADADGPNDDDDDDDAGEEEADADTDEDEEEETASDGDEDEDDAETASDDEDEDEDETEAGKKDDDDEDEDDEDEDDELGGDDLDEDDDDLDEDEEANVDAETDKVEEVEVVDFVPQDAEVSFIRLNPTTVAALANGNLIATATSDHDTEIARATTTGFREAFNRASAASSIKDALADAGFENTKLSIAAALVNREAQETAELEASVAEQVNARAKRLTACLETVSAGALVGMFAKSKVATLYRELSTELKGLNVQNHRDAARAILAKALPPFLRGVVTEAQALADKDDSAISALREQVADVDATIIDIDDIVSDKGDDDTDTDGTESVTARLKKPAVAAIHRNTEQARASNGRPYSGLFDA